MTHSFPTRRSSDLATPKAQEISTYKYIIVDSLCGMVMFVGMNKILLVTSSALGEHSTSRRIAQRLVEAASRSEEHTSELPSLMRISYAVLCLKKKNKQTNNTKYVYVTFIIT